MKRFIHFVVVVLLSLSAHATVVYIAQTAQGAATGVSCATAKSIATYNAGLISLAGDDTLYLCSEGGNFTTALQVQSSGTAGHVITISPAPTETVVFDLQSLGGHAFVNFNGQSYVTVDGVTGDACGPGCTTGGTTNTAYKLRVINLASAAGNQSYACYENNGGGNLAFKHVEVTGSGGSTSLNEQDGGCYISTPGAFEFAYNWIHGTNISTKLNATALTCFSSIGGTSYTSGCLAHHNLVQYLLHDGLRQGSHSSQYNNEVTGVDGSGHSDSLLTQSGSYAQTYNNYVHGSGDQNIYENCISASGAVTCAHWRVFNNIVSSSPGFGVVIDSTVEGGISSQIDDLVIANNTFYSTSGDQIRTVNRAGGSYTNLVLLNNIYGTNSDVSFRPVQFQGTTSFASASAWNYGLYSTAGANYPNIAAYTAPNQTLAQLQALSPSREANGAVGIPTYAVPGTDFHLASADTLAKATGLDLTATYSWLTLDRDGVTRPNGSAWSLGAYQFSGSSSPTATLTASPAVIKLGTSSTLTITTTNCVQASIDNGVGTVACSGTVSVSPTTATTYTLTVSGAGGTTPTTATATVTIGGTRQGANTIRTANTVTQ